VQPLDQEDAEHLALLVDLKTGGAEQRGELPRAVRELNRVMKTGLVFGSVTSDMAPALIDRYDLLRGVKKLGTWWEWSELFFGNGFDLSMHRRDVTDALWAATLAANKGPGQWYADSDSLRYSFFDKVADEDE